MRNAVLVGCLLVAGCAGTKTPFDELPHKGSSSATAVFIPNAVAGDNRARGVAGSSPKKAAADPEALRQVASRRLAEARARWEQAVRLDATNPAAAAPLFQSVVEHYPEYEYAAEARFRQGHALYRARAYRDAIRALKGYMQIAPVNPHLAEVEEEIYESSVHALDGGSGLLGFLRTDDAAIDGLKFVAETFPAGSYPDDALLRLGQYYAKDRDYASAALHYRELLTRYPDSEWSFRARIELADTYMARDQGAPYEAGFVRVDPREPVEGDAAIMAGPVDSAVALALEQYEAFLARMRQDPGRAVEYRREIQYATARAEEARSRLAAKALARADWYRRTGDLASAEVFERTAASWPSTTAGREALRRIEARSVQVAASGPRVVPAPPAGARVVPGPAPSTAVPAPSPPPPPLAPPSPVAAPSGPAGTAPSAATPPPGPAPPPPPGEPLPPPRVRTLP